MNGPCQSAAGSQTSMQCSGKGCHLQQCEQPSCHPACLCCSLPADWIQDTSLGSSSQLRPLVEGSGNPAKSPASTSALPAEAETSQDPVQRFRTLPHEEQVRQADRWSEIKPGQRARAITGFWPAVGKMLHGLEGARNTLIIHKVSLCPVQRAVLAGCGRYCTTWVVRGTLPTWACAPPIMASA